jgi:hypothetical protein
MVSIDSVSFGEVKVDGKVYYSDLIVWWDGSVEMIPKSHQFGMSELLNLLRRGPEAVILGTGMEGSVAVLEEVQQEMEDQKLLFFTESSPNALEVFNAMISEGKKAVAYIHCTS